MAQYINKTDLVTELERRRDLHFKVYLENGFESSESKYDENKHILSFIDNLKVLEIKEVDLEDEIVRVSKNEYFNFTDWKSIARHFYELGSNIHKGE